jgi:hypothetical protein
MYVVKDISFAEEGVIILSSKTFLKMLAIEDYWMMYGTFKVCP